MNIEFEAKFYINPDSFKQLVKEQGGKLIQPLSLMKRWIFVDKSQTNSWVRVRDEGDKITLSYKSFDDSKRIDSLKELELEINDFDKGCQMLKLLGLTQTRYVENMREVWNLSDCLLMIDQWPALEPFVEIEGPSEHEVERVTNQLGLDMSQACYGPTARLYEQTYGIFRSDFEQIHTLTFDDIPQILTK